MAGDEHGAVEPSLAIRPLVLSLDVGTSSVRAMLYDARARAVQGLEAQEQHQMRSTADGGVETDPEVLLARVERCLDRVLAACGPLAAEIEAVAPTTFWHNVLGTDSKGRPLTPLYTWADTRATQAAAALRRELDPVQVHARTGCVLHPSYLPAKLRWLQSTNRSLGRRVRHWLSFAELMSMHFFGDSRVSISMASGTGLLNQHTRTWDREVLAAIPLREDLLSLIDDRPRCGLLPAYAARWPALANLPWFPGWGDGATSNVGCGCVTRERVAMMVGTSGAMRAVWATPRFTIPERLWIYRVDARRIVVGGALSNGGNLIDWLRATLRLPDDLQALEKAIAAIEPAAHGLTILPFLAGERSTGWIPEARATISGLRLNTTSAEIARAGYEAVAYRFGLIHNLLRATVPQARAVVASGGALLHSPAWIQMMADVLGSTVTASAVPEASSRGAALLALESIGAIPSVEEITAPLGQSYEPDRARHRRYRQAAAKQQALYDLLVAPLGEFA